MQQNQNMQQAKNTRGQKHMKIKIPYKKAIFYKNPPCILQGDLFRTQKMPILKNEADFGTLYYFLIKNPKSNNSVFS